MADRPPYRTEPDPAFADRLEAVLVDRLSGGSFATPIDGRIVDPPPVFVLPPAPADPVDEWWRSVDLGPARTSPAHAVRPRIALMSALGVAAATALVALALLVRVGDDPGPSDEPTFLPSTTSPPSPPADPFEGAWWSTDVDGSSQSLVIVRRGDEYDVVLHDDGTSPCSESSSTERGTGRLDSASALEVRLLLTCDHASSLAVGPSSLTFSRRPRDGEMVDSVGVLWRRQEAMWPQSSSAQVIAAQNRADLGDPTATWQLDPQLAADGWWEHLEAAEAPIVERFLREEVGWNHTLLHPYQAKDPDGPADGVIRGLVFLRCALGTERCAPTLDDLRHEWVRLDLAQLGRRGTDGVWVVSRWELATPSAPTAPNATEAGARHRLEESDRP